MSDGPKYFSLEEANELVPTLELEFSRVARLRAELVPLVEKLGGAQASVGILQGGAPAPGGMEAQGARLRVLAAEISAAIERVNQLGCLVKDLDMGLVDFYSTRQGESVFLCWQFGEPGVIHWHRTDEGFPGRKPIEGIEIHPPEFLN
jgi:hypothetical protein